MLRSVEVQDYMLREPATIRANESVFEAIHTILTRNVSGLSVVDEQNKLIGFLSELDCLKAILSAVYNDAPYAGEVDEYMTKAVISVGLHDSIVDVAQDMLAYKHRRRPVIDTDGKLVGEVSCRRILRAVKEFAGPVDRSEH